MWPLSFISKRNFLKHVEATIGQYGDKLEPSKALMFSAEINWQVVTASYVSAVKFDLVHTAATVFFLFVLSDVMIEKIDRIKLKYGGL